jgi:hypothetical protein
VAAVANFQLHSFGFLIFNAHVCSPGRFLLAESLKTPEAHCLKSRCRSNIVDFAFSKFSMWSGNVLLFLFLSTFQTSIFLIVLCFTCQRRRYPWNCAPTHKQVVQHTSPFHMTEGERGPFRQSEQIQVTIDGQPYEVHRNQTIFQACKALNIFVPRLCYHPDLPPWGQCGVCVVVVDGTRFAYSCMQQILPGMKITTRSPDIRKKSREAIEEFVEVTTSKGQ